MSDGRDLLLARLRTNLRAFVRKTFEILNPETEFLDNWHLGAIAYQLERCEAGDLKRLLMNVPPRYLKSEAASVALVVWALGKNPARKFICVSYSDDLARQFSRARRKVMESEEFRELFPQCRISAEKNTENEIVTTAGGGCYATGIDGSIRGRGADYIVVDDPIKFGSAMSSAERTHVNRWYRETLYSRLNSKKDGVIIIVMQRIHEDDLTGSVLPLDDWEHLSLPAIAQNMETTRIGRGADDNFTRRPGDILHPEREGQETLEQIRRNMGSRAFEAQYQQSPTPSEGNVIKAEWLMRYDNEPESQRGDIVVQSWDTASSTGDDNAYSVCTTWRIRKDHFYLIDVLRKRFIYPDLVKAVVEQFDRYRPEHVLVERASTGQSLIDTLGCETRIRTIGVKPAGSKLDRADEASLPFEQGRVFLPREAPWLGEFENELLGFPETKFTDQIDSVSQFLMWTKGRKNHEKVTGSQMSNDPMARSSKQYFGKTHPQRNPKAPRVRRPW